MRLGLSKILGYTRWRCSGRFQPRRTQSRSPGFTVMETVMATFVFALALSGIAGSFLAIMRLDVKARSVRQVEQNSRFLSEFLTREIRNGVVNYGPGGYNGTIPSAGRTAVLHLINRDGQAERVTRSGVSVQLTRSGVTTVLSGSNVRVTRLDFYIRPTAAGDQALVTFVYQISSNNGSRPESQVTLNVQSTAAARDY